jgi:7-carboxy-7-deazaguanine synthase
VTGIALEERLRITEIFLSLQGETTFAGLPTVFVRLTGCPLRCGYCDTTYAFSGGEIRSISEIVDAVDAYGVRHVTVTGGEPLAQPGALALLRRLCDHGYVVSLETSGALDAGVRRGGTQPLGQPRALRPGGSGQVRDLQSLGLRVGKAQVR